jgi:hypothetical protein
VRALVTTNLAIVLAFGILYGAAATHAISQSVFRAMLIPLLVAGTALWVHVERAQRVGLRPLARALRMLGALAFTVVGIPVLVMMPLQCLAAGMTPSANFGPVALRAATLVAVSLVMVTAVNLLGGLITAGIALVGGRNGAAPGR